MSDETIRKAVVYLPRGYNALEAVGFMEVLSLLPGFRSVVAAARPGPIVSDSGALTIVAEVGFDDIDAAELLLIPGGRIVELLEDDDFLAWVKTIDATTRFTTAMCVGRAVLGAAGLLNGVHVAAQPVPLPGYGAIEVPMRLVSDGKIVTGANATSSIDLGLHIAAQYVDPATARAIQVSLEYDADSWEPPYPPRNLPEPGPGELAALMSLVSTGARAEIVREIYGYARCEAPF